MKVPLKIRPCGGQTPDCFTEVHWTHAAPFLLNPRGILVHRLQSVKCHMESGRYRHTSVDYLCGNGTCGKGVGEFLHEPPPDRLVCAVCEGIAISRGLPSSSELAGRHVCVGRLKAERLCCNTESKEEGHDYSI